MNHALRIAASVAILLGLSGCNIVVSEDPWFTAADAAPAPVLRDGLWLAAESDCRFDDARPAEQWPDCADAFFVRGEERWSMQWDTDAGDKPRRTFAGWEPADPFSDTLFVASGDHLIMQAQTQGEPADPPPDGGDAGAGKADSRAYIYGAIRPGQLDDEGKVLAFETWFIQCGPLPEPKLSPRRKNSSWSDVTEEQSPSVTDKPFPGLTVIDDVCIAESVEALRQAAVLSEAIGTKEKSRWVREGWR
jgi:hypothetical protein